jgi:hypothetical protein
MSIYFCEIPSCAIGVSLIILLLGGTVWLAIRSNLLRDQITDPVSFVKTSLRIKKYAQLKFENKDRIPRPFSLSRTQLAIWTSVIGSTYLYLYFCRYPGQPIAFDRTTLALLGISAGTTTAGIIIDKGQTDRYRHQNQPSTDFFQDILSDENGISIGRFQQFIWLIISVAVYLFQLPTLTAGHFPSLDPALLMLSGISSAAYLTLKAGENTGNGANAAYVNSYLAAGSQEVTKLPTPGKPDPGKQTQPRP